MRATWLVAACLAVSLPVLVSYNLPPSSTFFNQIAAFIGWGVFLLVLSSAMPTSARPRSRGRALALAALGLMLASALATPFWTGFPWALALSNVGTLLAAALTLWVATAVAAAGLGRPAFQAFCIALVIAGLGSAVVGLVQVYAPQWADGTWLSHTSLVGRAVGNVRQPNHLSSLLLWSIVAAIWLGESSRPGTGAAGKKPAAPPVGNSRSVHGVHVALLATAVLFLYVVLLSASRTGALGTLTLATWGLLDRRLSRPARVALLLAPLAYAAMWHGAAMWAQYTGSTFVGESRFTATENITSSRVAIWSNTLELIRSHPWRGVGFGEYNFAWTLTPFPGRPTEFFDHAHNLPLHLFAEMGVPLAAIVIGLLAGGVAAAAGHAIKAGRGFQGSSAGPAAPMERAALVMVLLVSVHSLLEYPLWYSYFLLPTVFALGLCSAGASPTAATTSVGESPSPSTRAAPSSPAALRAEAPHRTRPAVVASMLLVLGGVLALYDYARVVVIFAPPVGAAPLAERIDAGRRSVLFAHHADYALATTARRPGTILQTFDRAPHYLLDARLMMAWAVALDESRDTDRARHVSARLREFSHPQAAAFFAVCNEAAEVSGDMPFQCETPTRAYGYEDFLPAR